MMSQRSTKDVSDPLVSTFCFAPGVGLGTERNLWSSGIVHWDHVHPDGVGCLGAKRIAALRSAIDRARQDLEAGRPDFVRDGLGNAETWRAYPRYRTRAVYLDIETTGLFSWDKVTLIGMYDGEALTILERGKNLNEFPRLIRNYSLIVSFNGRSFDVPFLQREFPKLRLHQAHWDLRWAFHALGRAGSLKHIERDFGLVREGALAGLSVPIAEEWDEIRSELM